MKINNATFAAVLALALASAATAALTGDTYNFSTSQTGSVTIAPLGAGGSFIVPAGPAFCVGPNSDNCATSGLAGSISFNAAGTQIIFSFAGSTGFATGSFVLNLTNFVPANIVNVTLNSGSLVGGTFGLTSFSSSQMIFTGSVNNGLFNAVGGSTIVFDVATDVVPTVTKTFTPGKVTPGGTSTLSISIVNPNAGVSETGVNFTDTFPAGVVVASPVNGVSTCGGATAATAGGNTLTLTGGTIAAGGSCSVRVNVVGNTEGVKNNSVTVSSDFGSAAPATATLTVALAPLLSKSFNELTIGQQNTETLKFTLQNSNTSTTLTGLAFTDPLPAGLVVGTPNGLTGVCDGGTITAVAGSNSVSLSGATLAAGASCTFSVTVHSDGTASGTLTNTTSTVTSNEAIPGAAATATVFAGDPVHISYAANLAVGDSVTDITNTGASGAALQAGTTASITGALCANIYAFTPDEQLVSCCSCPVTPGGLVSLSAKNDLASNTLTPAIPTALVIKVVASTPQAGSCNNSAASVTAATLANGLKAFETTIHATPTAGTYGVTETPFSASTLSAGELNKISNLCNFILANGSGFGVCRSCTLGGLGSTRQ